MSSLSPHSSAGSAGSIDSAVPAPDPILSSPTLPQSTNSDHSLPATSPAAISPAVASSDPDPESHQLVSPSVQSDDVVSVFQSPEEHTIPSPSPQPRSSPKAAVSRVADAEDSKSFSPAPLDRGISLPSTHQRSHLSSNSRAPLDSLVRSDPEHQPQRPLESPASIPGSIESEEIIEIDRSTPLLSSSPQHRFTEVPPGTTVNVHVDRIRETVEDASGKVRVTETEIVEITTARGEDEKHFLSSHATPALTVDPATPQHINTDSAPHSGTTSGSSETLDIGEHRPPMDRAVTNNSNNETSLPTERGFTRLNSSMSSKPASSPFQNKKIMQLATLRPVDFQRNSTSPFKRVSTVKPGSPSDPVAITDEENYLAAVYIKDALNYWDPNHYSDPDGLKLYMIYRSKWYSYIFLLIVLANLLLGFWEDSLRDGISSATGKITPAVELFCLCCILGDCVFRYYAESKSIVKDRWMQTQFIIAILTIIDIIQFIVLSASGVRTYRILRVARVFALVNYSFDTRTQAKQVILTFKSMIVPFILLLFLMFIEAVLALILFYEPGSSFNPASPYAPSFDSFLNIYFSMFFLFTTENFPDIAFPSIRQYGLISSLFFIFCLVVGVYVICNLTLAAVYNKYREIAIEDAREKLKLRNASLMLAFELLARDNQGGLSLAMWTSVSQYFPSMGIIKLPPGEKEVNSTAELYFQLIDKDHSGSIDLREFYHLCDELFLRFGKLPVVRIPNPIMKGIDDKYFQNPNIQMLRVILTIINIAILVDPFSRCSENFDCIYHPLGIMVVDTLFLAYMVVEMGLLLGIHGWIGIWNDGWNRFHFLIVLFSVFGKILFEFILAPTVTLQSSLVIARFALFLRSIRLARVVIIVDSLRQGLSAILSIIVSLLLPFTFIIIIYYVFGIIGMELFSGILAADNPAIADTAFTVAGYNDIINFDALENAFFTFFHLQSLNNWHITSSAIMIASGTQFAILYIISFYFLTTLTTVNLLIALIIETIEHKLRTHESEVEQAKKRKVEFTHTQYQIVGGSNVGRKDAKLELFRSELDD